MNENVRVMRTLEYIGPRDAVEKTLNNGTVPSQGERTLGRLTIRSGIIGNFPEVCPKEKKEDKFANLVNAAIEANRYARTHYKNEIVFMENPISWMMDNCTVKIDIGRATGKTKYIIDNATEWDVIVATGVSADIIKRKTFGKHVHIHNNFNSFVGRSYGNTNIVYIDEPSRFLTDYCTEFAFYSLFTKADMYKITFVLLGR